MKTEFLFTAVLLTSLLALGCQSDNAVLEVVYCHPGPVIKKGDPGTENNKHGFEGTRAFKFNGIYHLFTSEMIGDPMYVKMRMAHWQSTDAVNFKRVSTLYESSGDHTGQDPRACLWSPMPIYNEKQGRWNMFYVAYKSRRSTSGGWYVNYEGRIFRAVSTTPGIAGFGGPYEDIGIILEPGSDSGPWEGSQGVDSFFPYPVGSKWYAFYGSAQRQRKQDRDPNYPEWTVSLASAPAMAGPWKRCNKLNPILTINEKFVENPIVSQMEDGSYIALFDGGPLVSGLAGTFGYTLSKDGINWSKAVYIDLESKTEKWWAMMRTPLGLIPEGNGIFTVFYTAYREGDRYGCIGMVRLKSTRYNRTIYPEPAP